MGKEYYIKCPKFDTQATQQFLERRFVVSATEGGFLLSLRNAVTAAASNSLHDWAPVMVSLDSERVYFLDTLAYPDQAANIFMQVVEFLLSRAEEITITEP